MKQRELIDYCTNDANNGCDICPYDAECDIYVDMYGTTPACEKRVHPERYTDEDIGLIDGELAIKKQSTIQPEERTEERTETHACDSKAMMYMMKCMEEKLRELMNKEAYIEFTTKIAKEAFLIEVEGMEDDEFKKFTLANFDDITAEPDKHFIALADALYVARESEK